MAPAHVSVASREAPSPPINSAKQESLSHTCHRRQNSLLSAAGRREPGLDPRFGESGSHVGVCLLCCLLRVLPPDSASSLWLRRPRTGSCSASPLPAEAGSRQSSGQPGWHRDLWVTGSQPSRREGSTSPRTERFWSFPCGRVKPSGPGTMVAFPPGRPLSKPWEPECRHTGRGDILFSCGPAASVMRLHKWRRTVTRSSPRT